MEPYTIYYTPAQQSAMASALPFLNIEEAEWFEEPDVPHFSLVQELNENQAEDCQTECQAERIIGIKPGSNPGGSPNGCA